MRAFALLLFAIGVFVAVGPSEVAGAAKPARGPLVTKATFVQLAGPTTLQVRIGRQTRFVHLIGVKAPVCACGSANAPARLGIELRRGETLSLRGDPALPQTDGQGRLLAYARLPSGRDIGYSLVEFGEVEVDRAHHFARIDRYMGAEASAREIQSGIWSCRPEPATADLALTAVAPAQVGYASPFTATATITNNGPGPARQVTLTSNGNFMPAAVEWSPTWPDDSELDSYPHVAWAYTLGGCAMTLAGVPVDSYGDGPTPTYTTLRCTAPYLPVGATWQVRLDVPSRLGYDPSFGDTANLTVSTCTNDPDPGNNTAAITTATSTAGS
jgi:endonuclease YncB( thermonuclease family)